MNKTMQDDLKAARAKVLAKKQAQAQVPKPGMKPAVKQKGKKP